MTREQKREVKKTANEHFDGDLQLASAAHVHGFGVVKKVGSQMVDWFDHDKIKEVQTAVETDEKTPAKKPAAKKSKK